MALGEALEDSEPQVRMNSALALLRLGPAATPAVPSLIKALRDPANRKDVGQFLASVAQTAALTLGRIGPPAREAIPVLAEVSTDNASDKLLRKDAVEALKRIDVEQQK